jgi:hypothetical protein
MQRNHVTVEAPKGDPAPLAFPRIGLLGLVLIGVGLFEALVGAMASPDTGSGHSAVHDVHLLAFVGMVLVLAGVLRASSRKAARSRLEQTEDSDAVR